MDIESLEKAMYGDVEDDEELMAELLALEAEEREAGHIPASPKAPDITTHGNNLDHQGRIKQTVSSNVRRTSSYGISSVSDISDEDVGSDPEDINDPDLLAELSLLTGQEINVVDKVEQLVSSESSASSNFTAHKSGDIDTAMLHRLQELKEDYDSVLKSAKETNNVIRARRCQRGLDKIEELIGKVQAGKLVDSSDIPVSFKEIRSSGSLTSGVISASPKHQEMQLPKSTQPAVEMLSAVDGICKAPTTDSKVAPEKGLLKGEQLRAELYSRRESYIKNAKEANALGDKKTAYEYYTVAKQFDEAIKAMNDGQVTECEESELPPPATPYKPVKHEVIPQPPKTLLEGLQQRMQKYLTLADQSKAENNDRKYRMNLRIVKQYENAICCCRSNRPFNTSDLPCPPGYPPLPSPSSRTAVNVASGAPSMQRPLPEVGPLAASEPSTSGRQSRQKQQLAFLLKRQLQFKQAAIAAKNKGDVPTAKKLLLAAKGFDKMIAASKAGLPVNIEKTPIPPQVRTSSKTLKPSLEHHTSFDAAITGTPSEIYATMEKDLIKQVKQCEESRLAFTRLGDVTRVKMFETWSSESKRNLIMLRELAKRGASIPPFRYEARNIPSVEICLDVDEHHIELTIVRVTDARLPAGSRSSSTLLCFASYLNGSKRKRRRKNAPSWKPSDGYLFVKYNFAFPHDAHQIGKTKVVDATNSPEYNEKFLLTINRKMKQLQRVIKRNCLKFEVYQKGGFLRSDRLIATADCKLSDLEEKAHIHECINLMDGRKLAGGKLEYQVRIREALGAKKLNLKETKWLILEC